MPLLDKLIVWQNDLLDMSRSNNVLYFRSTGRGAGIRLRIDDELNDVFSRFMTGTKPVALPTLHPELEEDELDHRLARLRSRVRDDFNDRGLQTLFLVFGLLEWHEAQQSDESIVSPLVLLPVGLTREGLLGTYKLQRLTEDEIEVNPTLREKLQHDFHIELPTFSELEDQFEQEIARESANGGRAQSQLTLNRILNDLGAALPTQFNARIVPELHLGRFSFQKLAMYRDLQRHQSEALAHPLLRALSEDVTNYREADGLVLARDLDKAVLPHDVLEVLSADSSQQEAIFAAKRGASFVLQGPPGTGKSQTIANMIAELLGMGKRVLFVSEKMAALQVVRNRLDAAGIAEFCLDLHDHRADKKAFIADLKASTQSSVAPPVEGADIWLRESDSLQRTRQELNQFVHELHLPRFSLHESAYHAYGILAHHANTPDIACEIEQVTSLTHTHLEELRAAIATLEQHAEVLDRQTTHPWRQIRTSSYSLQLASDIRAHFGRLSECVRSLDEAVIQLSALLGVRATSRDWAYASSVTALGEVVLTSALPPRHWLNRATIPAIKSSIRESAARASAYEAHQNRLRASYTSSFTEVDPAPLLSALTTDTAAVIACLRGQGQTPQDAAIQHREELTERLRVAISTLDALTPAVHALAAACGAHPPATVGEIAELADIAAQLLNTPTPSEHWLDPRTFPTIRAQVQQIAEVYAFCATERNALSSKYDESFLGLDLRSLAKRFNEAYTSPLHYFAIAYYRDVKTLRATAKPNTSLDRRHLAADLTRVVRLLDTEASLRAHYAEHAQVLGETFEGARTNWKSIRESLEWATKLHRLLVGMPISADMRHAALGSPRQLKAIEQRYQRFSAAWSVWRDVATFLDTVIDFGVLQGSDGLLDDAPLSEVATALTQLVSGLDTFWDALDTIAAHQIAGSHSSVSSSKATSWVRLCDDLSSSQRVRGIKVWFAENDESLRAALGSLFVGIESNWALAQKKLEWTEQFLTNVVESALSPELLLLISDEGDARDRHHLSEIVQTAHQRSSQILDELAYSDTILPREALTLHDTPFQVTPLEEVHLKIDYLIEHLPELEQWLAAHLALDACRSLRLSSVIDTLLREQPFPRDAVARFEKRFYTLLIDQMRQQSSMLRLFRGVSHEQLIERFRALDRNHIHLARVRLRTHLAEVRRLAIANAPSGSEMQEIKRLVQLKRHKSIRHIVQHTRGALLRTKPCWMMSPLSVSQYLDDVNLFDTVIFDEASQVCAEDAISAILRGRQLIVVGDSKQLPPTRFFAKSLADEEDEDDGSQANAPAERVESILNECAVRLPERMLRWHYRSQHESLIAFSNQHFYNNDLITFPSPQGDHADGVRFVYVENGRYDRSRSRTNRIEAERVVDLILEHIERDATVSLGVVALSAAQQAAIQDALLKRVKDLHLDGVWGDALDQDKPGGFFIKNLESVQGDERDVIIMSVGYGRHADDQPPHTNFGPVNRTGGERRLNVAVTRARTQFILVSSMRAQDLPAAMTSPGARTLRDYLAYAERGPLALADQSSSAAQGAHGLQFDSPFEEAVYAALTAHNLMLDTQVGCSGYRIDLAVRDATEPGRYLLGIECDGATYHSSATARDRDHLRQHHLETMGWRIHRIWSTDWVRDPVGEIAKVLEAVTRQLPPTMPIVHRRVDAQTTNDATLPSEVAFSDRT